ncbi:MAG: hypothetical protein KGL55_01880 [Rhodospirillales bacterium]|nr:hypothetical protein [Rhodospirillales bacterium]
MTTLNLHWPWTHSGMARIGRVPARRAPLAARIRQAMAARLRAFVVRQSRIEIDERMLKDLGLSPAQAAFQLSHPRANPLATRA